MAHSNSAKRDRVSPKNAAFEILTTQIDCLSRSRAVQIVFDRQPSSVARYRSSVISADVKHCQKPIRQQRWTALVCHGGITSYTYTIATEVPAKVSQLGWASSHCSQGGGRLADQFLVPGTGQSVTRFSYLQMMESAACNNTHEETWCDSVIKFRSHRMDD